MGLFTKKKKEEKKVLDQDLSKKAEYGHLFMIHFLFEDEPEMPEFENIKKSVQKRFGDIDVISTNKELCSFGIKKYVAQFKEGAMTPQIMLMKGGEFQIEKIDQLQMSQLWDVENGREILEQCKGQVMISDMMAATMEYKDRCEMMMDWMEEAITLFPKCKAVWFPSSGKLFTADMIRNHNIPPHGRFVYFAVNARFFNIQESEDMLVDTLGLYAIGLPDIQYHFHDLNPNDVVNHAYNVASYVYDNEAPIKSGETIDGFQNSRINPDIQWKCQYEDSMIQPVRGVMDVCPGEFAAGNRE